MCLQYLAAAAATATGIISAPVAGTIATVAGVGYGAYYAYNYLTEETEVAKKEAVKNKGLYESEKKAHTFTKNKLTAAINQNKKLEKLIAQEDITFSESQGYFEGKLQDLKNHIALVEGDSEELTRKLQAAQEMVKAAKLEVAKNNQSDKQLNKINKELSRVNAASEIKDKRSKLLEERLRLSTSRSETLESQLKEIDYYTKHHTYLILDTNVFLNDSVGKGGSKLIKKLQEKGHVVCITETIRDELYGIYKGEDKSVDISKKAGEALDFIGLDNIDVLPAPVNNRAAAAIFETKPELFNKGKQGGNFNDIMIECTAWEQAKKGNPVSIISSDDNIGFFTIAKEISRNKLGGKGTEFFSRLRLEQTMDYIKS